MNFVIHSIEDFKSFIKDAEAFRLKRRRPFIAVSFAQSVDGSIASRNKGQLLLSGPKSSILTHQLRASCDAILIGIGTLLADDPQLTVRLAAGPNPQPIILDTRLRTPLAARLIQRTDLSPWIVNGQDGTHLRATALRQAGARPLTCATAGDGHIDLLALMDLLTERKVNSLMVEGGAKVITSFVNAGLVDQFIITISPKLVGGLRMIDSKGFKAASHLDLGQVKYQPIDDDLIMWARPKW
jgi:riboflavin-specific deaminase-like protein